MLETAIVLGLVEMAVLCGGVIALVYLISRR